MTDMQDLRVSVQQGAGVVAHVGGAVLLVLPESPSQEAMVEELVAAVERAGEAPAKSAALARQLGTLVATAADGAVPPFGAVTPSTSGIAVFLHGAVDLRTDGADGPVHLSGTDATTWVDRIIDGSFDTLELGPTGATPAPPGGRAGDLRDGIVPGAGVILAPRQLPTEPVIAAVRAPAVPAPEAEAGAVVEPEVVEPEAPALEMEAPEPVEPQAPLKPEWFMLDTGASFRLDRSYVLGRAPEEDVDVMSGDAQPILLDDPDRVVSRVHARILLEGEEVVVLDAGSANGTFVADADGDWARIEPGTPHPIVAGTRILLGERSLIVEGPRPPAEP